MDIKISQRSYLDISEAHDLKKLIPVFVQARTKKKRRRTCKNIAWLEQRNQPCKHYHHRLKTSSSSFITLVVVKLTPSKEIARKITHPFRKLYFRVQPPQVSKFHRCMCIHGDFEEAAMAATNRLNQQRLFNLIKVCNLDCSAPTKLRGNFPYLYGDGESCRVRQDINSLLLKTKLQS